MRKFIIAAVAVAALAVPTLAIAGGGNSDAANACKQGGWQNLVRQDGTGFKNQGDCVSYAAKGGVPKAKAAPSTAVSEPTFNYNVNSCSVTVPYTPGIDTRPVRRERLLEETPITHDVTITAGLAGVAGTAGQFWVGYKAQPGYVDSNPGAGTSHIDFYNGDLVADCGATGDVTWDYQGTRHRHRQLQRGRDRRLARLQEQQRHVAQRRRHLVQADRRPHGRLRRHDHRRQPRLHRLPPRPRLLLRQGCRRRRPAAAIRSRCSRTKAPRTDATGDYDMSLGAGIVTGGNLVVH